MAENINVINKFGAILQNFINRRNDIVIRKIYEINDKESFSILLHRLSKVPCLKKASCVNQSDIDKLKELIDEDFKKTKIELLVRAYEIYLDKNFILE
ncbi:MAG: hypothetical protein SVN78_04595 [Deferribacterota bacterium]|nr:hypothetical protein [Deferribacterota bacterium]